MKGVKIKFSKTDGVIVTVPYKHGSVKWKGKSTSKFTYNWVLYSCNKIYKPARVLAAHSQFLYGAPLQRKIIKAAAASHEWEFMRSHKTMLDYMLRCRQLAKDDEDQ